MSGFLCSLLRGVSIGAQTCTKGQNEIHEDLMGKMKPIHRLLLLVGLCFSIIASTVAFVSNIAHGALQRSKRYAHESSSASNNDWLEAEFTLRNLPIEPSQDLTPEQIARTVCRSLQFVDHPTESAGLARCFPFFTFECRKLVTARQGGETVERFCRYGILSPALQPFMGASRLDLGEPTWTAAQPPLRGALVSYPIEVTGADVLALQYASGIVRNGVTVDPPKVSMVMRLEQQRRPPLQGCWLVREILDVRYAFAGDMGNAHVGG